MKRVFLTENQFKLLTEHEMIMESIFEAESLDEFKKILKGYVRKLILAGASIALITSIISRACDKYGLSSQEKQEITQELTANNNGSEWQLAHDKVIGTVYNAVPAQCKPNSNTTASNFRLNMYDVASHRIIAMERTFMKQLGLHYGDVVKVEGAGDLDGIWQIQDTMNKRFAGMPKIDFLVPENRKSGMWNGTIRLYTLKNPTDSIKYTAKMAPQVSKEESIRQLKQKRAEWAKKKKMQNNRNTKK